jgi:anti-sigma regulatory factor (Ser/Thr protein kinase)
MTETEPAILDFRMLDGLAFAAARGRLNEAAIPALTASEIGPLFELSNLADDGLLPAPHVALWLTTNLFGPMLDAIRHGTREWVCPQTRRAGFLSTATPHDINAWTTFGLAAQQAATAEGFPKAIAAQLTAAMGELHSNIYEHAQEPQTGIVAFRASKGKFEFISSDRGIGVLKSLRSNAAYARLNDHGEALRLTLTDGISRYEHQAERGHGFRPLFIGLANLNGALRFRSGDHALLIDGKQPTLMTARPAQKPQLRGFFVSVSCAVNGHPRHGA